VEKRDLEVHVSFGFICRGPLVDYAAIRDFIRSLPKTRLIYHTGSTRKLRIIREREEGEDERKREETGGQSPKGTGGSR